MGWRRAALACAIVAGGCGRGVVAPPPEPAPPLHPPLEAPALPGDGATALVPPPEPIPDEILSSPLLRDASFRREVDRWTEHWKTTARRWMPEYLERMGWFAPVVDSALAREGLPPSLRYLPVVESGYNPRAVSRARAVGLWQFMAGTAAGMGMEVGPLLDERRNPFRSTEAAARFLRSLRERFGSWYLALAAYNAGPARIQGILDRHAPLLPRSDSLYWSLRRYLPPETRDFVPKLLGAVRVAGDPARYGIDVRDQGVAFDFDEVVVPDATTLDVVARAAGASEAEVVRLNPEVVRGITPPGRETIVRVPKGSARRFRENYARIPPQERVTFVEHRVRRGETLSHIARRYGVPLADLRAANPGVRARYLRIGQRLIVPVAPSVRRSTR